MTQLDDGVALIRIRLDGVANSPKVAPDVLTGRDALLWREAQAQAYRDALYLLGAPKLEPVSDDDKERALSEAIYGVKESDELKGPEQAHRRRNLQNAVFAFDTFTAARVYDRLVGGA